jgi:hypothetical protein
LTQAFRDIEKLQISLERKVALDQFNERLESKADKQMVLNAVMNKVSKIEMDQQMSHKADKREVDIVLRNLEVRIQEEVTNINEEMAGKANVDDL